MTDLEIAVRTMCNPDSTAFEKLLAERILNLCARDQPEQTREQWLEAKRAEIRELIQKRLEGV